MNARIPNNLNATVPNIMDTNALNISCQKMGGGAANYRITCSVIIPF
jgi:hypothetical protein